MKPTNTRADINRINKTAEENRIDSINYQMKKEEEETMNASKIITAAETVITCRPYATRSAWNRGLTEYAMELLEGLKEAIDGGYFDPEDLAAPRLVARELLNGASDWDQYSWGGSSLIYDGQIAARLCNKSELKKTDNGHKEPNNREQWLDVQARALYQAAELVKSAIAAAVKTI